LIICEYGFEKPNPRNPDYSLAEVEYYPRIPSGSMLSNHSLSLRKNLVTGKFEMYRRHYRGYVSAGRGLMADGDAVLENVVFRSSNLEKALEFAHKECVKYHGKLEKDRVCKHECLSKTSGCERITEAS
jgi:hypothetical protein